MAKCRIKNADFGVLFDLAIKYDKIIKREPAKERNEHMHVINAMVKAFPDSIFLVFVSKLKIYKLSTTAVSVLALLQLSNEILLVYFVKL